MSRTKQTPQPPSYQAPIEAFVYELDQVWLLPKNGGFTVHVGPDNRAAIGFVGPIDGMAQWRVHRLDMWEETFGSAALAARKLLLVRTEEDQARGTANGWATSDSADSERVEDALALPAGDYGFSKAR